MALVVDRQLGFIEPVTAGMVIQAGLNWWDSEKVKRLVPEFPGIFNRAVMDLGKFKAGLAAGLFDRQQRNEIMGWFLEFPRVWETIRLNFIKTDAGREFGGRVDDFCGRIRKVDLDRISSLGLPPVVIAGVVVVGGVAAGLWAVAYIQRQANISEMIDQVTAGALPPEVLVEAMKAEQTSGLFAGVGRIGSAIAFAAAAWLVYNFTRKK